MDGNKLKWTENEKKVIEKVSFYCSEKLPAHVLTIPKGTYKDGLFLSELISDKFFWFFEKGAAEKSRLFISEIYDIKDFKEKKQ